MANEGNVIWYDYNIDYRPASEHWAPSELMAAVLYLPNRDGVGAAEVNANSYPERDSILFWCEYTIGSDNRIWKWTSRQTSIETNNKNASPPPNKIDKTGTTDTRGRIKCNGFSLVVESAGLKANPSASCSSWGWKTKKKMEHWCRRCPSSSSYCFQSGHKMRATLLT